MGDENQIIYIKKFERELAGPYLEIGSKDYGAVQVLRSVFGHKDSYIGVDMQEGAGVDVVLDFTENFSAIDKKLNGMRFGTIFCISVMEHCDQPFKMAENLTSLLKPGGKLCISAPFSWKYHGFPSDYWRFTPQGIEKLFPGLEFHYFDSLASSSKKNELCKPDTDIGKINFSFKKQRENGHLLRAMSVKILKALSAFGILKWLVGYRYLLKPTMINMVGTLPKQKSRQ